MELRRRKIASWIFVGVILVSCCWLLFSSDEYHRFACEARDNYPDQSLDKGNFNVVVVFKAYATCLGSFFDAHDGAITALATVLLAIFTVNLAVATSRLKDISARQVKMASETERPWLFIERVKVMRRPDARTDPVDPNSWMVSFLWRNIGRSPALIEECIFNIAPKADLPDIPNYEGAQKLGCQSSIAVGGQLETKPEVGPGPVLRTKDGKAIELTIYGKLTYKELNSSLHHTGFAIDVSPYLLAQSTNTKMGYEYYD